MIQAIIFGIVVVVVIVMLANRRKVAEGQGTSGGLRQVFFYVFSFAAALVAANGVSMLVTYTVDSLRGGQDVSANDNLLALGLALTLVGAPSWLFVWTRIQKSIAANPEEARFFVRGLYMYSLMAISLGFFAAGLVSLVETFLGGVGLRGTFVARPVAWGGLWAYHWWLESRLTREDRAGDPFRPAYVYIASLAALVMLLVGLGLVFQRLFDRVYVSLFLDGVIINAPLWSEPLKAAIATAVVGAAGWAWHWHLAAKADARSVARLIYIYLFGVMAGVVTIVVSLSLAVIDLLQWLFGTPSLPPAADHFQSLTSIIPALLAGSFLWAYHAATLREEPSTTADAASIRRIYNYLLASISLGALAVGLVFLVALVITATAGGGDDYLVRRTGWQGQLSIVLTLLAVGGSFWAFYWSRAQKSATANPRERHALSRRIHIYAVFAVSALTALGSLSAALYLLLKAILDGDLSGQTVDDMKWALGPLLAAGIVSGYFWLVIQEDRAAAPSPAEPARQVRKRVTVLAPAGAAELSNRLESLLGQQVTIWTVVAEQAAPTLSDEQVSEIAERIAAAPVASVLVTVDETGAHVTPYTAG
jgi:hypothetical protein